MYITISNHPNFVLGILNVTNISIIQEEKLMLSLSLMFLSFHFACYSSKGLVGDSDRPLWDPEINNSPTDYDNNFPSSTSLYFNWLAPEGSIDHYELHYETSESSSKTLLIDANQSSVIIEELKSNTQYNLQIVACINDDCSEQVEAEEESNNFSSITPIEVWQFIGEGNSTEGLVRILPQGSRSPSALSISGIEQERVIISYIDPSTTGGVRFARITSIDDSEENDNSVINVTMFEENGLSNSFDDSRSINSVHFTSAQMKPTMVNGEPVIRLFATAEDIDGNGTLFSIDSTDGLDGIDYRIGSDTLCDSLTQYNSDEHCQLEYLISPDQVITTPPILSYERLQLGWRTYEEAQGGINQNPFLIAQGIGSCQQDDAYPHLFTLNHDEAYNDWSIQTDDDSCAKPLVTNAMYPALVNHHTSQMKMYYYSTLDSTYKLLYLDSQNDIFSPDFIEVQSAARDIQFIYANGVQVEPQIIQQMHEISIFIPPSSLSTENNTQQSQWMLITLPDDDGEPNGGVGLAFLKNP
jgi:hypothetical protein